MLLQDLRRDEQSKQKRVREKESKRILKKMGLQVPLAGLKQGKSLLEHTTSTENGVSLAGKRLAPAFALEADTGASRCGTPFL